MLGSDLHCIRCAQPSLVQDGEKAFRCHLCGFVYFHNVAAAVGAIIVCEDQVLLVERAHPPAQGKLDLPGGFEDYFESNEQALTRELFEELQLVITDMRYLGSYPNQYLYKDVLYFTTDSFFEITLANWPALVVQQDEVRRYLWVELAKVDTSKLAFVSGQCAMAKYLYQSE